MNIINKTYIKVLIFAIFSCVYNAQCIEGNHSSDQRQKLVVEATVLELGIGSAFHWYPIEISKIILAPLDYKFSKNIKVAVESYKEIPVGKKLELQLVYYNEKEPKFGWRVETWKVLK